MAYTPTNNPYMPGDPYSYDLKWMVEEVKKAQAVGEAAAGSAEAAAASAEAAGDSAYNAATSASNALIFSQNAEANAEDAATSAETAAGVVAPVTQALNTQGQQISVLEGRMDTFASLTEGSTTADAELQDIRVAADGTVYPTAGDAVRGQVNGLNTSLSNEEKIVNAFDDAVTLPKANGRFADSTFEYTAADNVFTFNGTYSASTRRRFKIFGQYATVTSTVPEAWYNTLLQYINSQARPYILEAQIIGGSCSEIPAGSYAFNIQAYDTEGNLILNTQYETDGFVVYRAIKTANLGAVFVTVNRNYTFTEFSFTVKLKEVEQETAFVSASGNDEFVGSKTAPLKTINKAIDLGYRRIIAAPGLYNEAVSITGGDLELIPWIDSEAFPSNYSVPYRPKIELIKGTALTIAVGATPNIYQAPFTASETSNLYRVFIDRTIPPTTQGELALEYNCLFFGDKPNGIAGNNRQRLYTPVLTEAELTAEGTFYYDGEYIKFHPWNNTLDDAYYVADDSNETALSLVNMNKVHLEDVRIIGAYINCAYIKNCNDVTIKACEFGISAKGMGLRLDNCDAVISDCHAFGCSADGFNLHEYGSSHFIGCTSFYNGDDGISHHQGCAGIIEGGEWAFNASGGITPAFGSQIEVRNTYCHDNDYGIQYLGRSGNRRTLLCSGNLLKNNSAADLYANYYDIIAWSNIYTNKITGNYGTITEF